LYTDEQKAAHNVIDSFKGCKDAVLCGSATQLVLRNKLNIVFGRDGSDLDIFVGRGKLLSFIKWFSEKGFGMITASSGGSFGDEGSFGSSSNSQLELRLLGIHQITTWTIALGGDCAGAWKGFFPLFELPIDIIECSDIREPLGDPDGRRMSLIDTAIFVASNLRSPKEIVLLSPNYDGGWRSDAIPFREMISLGSATDSPTGSGTLSEYVLFFKAAKYNVTRIDSKLTFRSYPYKKFAEAMFRPSGLNMCGCSGETIGPYEQVLYLTKRSGCKCKYGCVVKIKPIVAQFARRLWGIINSLRGTGTPPILDARCNTCREYLLLPDGPHAVGLTRAPIKPPRNPANAIVPLSARRDYEVTLRQEYQIFGEIFNLPETL
jgi:hypothetical protein